MADHRCPAPDCYERVPPDMVACKRHWLQVPKDVRQRVWSEYRKQPGSAAHARALVDAVASLQ